MITTGKCPCCIGKMIRLEQDRGDVLALSVVSELRWREKKSKIVVVVVVVGHTSWYTFE